MATQPTTLAQLEKKGVLKRNQNQCSHCTMTNLPEPISWAKLCRLTGDYVCDGCYTASLFAMVDMEAARG